MQKVKTVRPDYKVARRMVLSIAGGFILLIAGIVTYVVTTMPPISEIENPQIDLSTQIYSADNKQLGNFYTEYRVNVRLDQISPHVLNALIATEDKRFYDHSGIDLKALFVMVKDLVIEGRPRGASTITMQLARNLYDAVGKERSVWRKIKEMIMAVVLERLYTKEEIVTSYLNTVTFGGNSFGIQAGSKVFFGKDCKNLNPEEAALLIAVLKGTSEFNPKRHPEKAQARRNVVLTLMEENQFLTKPERDSLVQLPLGLNYRIESHNEGLATYFREFLRDWLKGWSEERGFNLYEDGLKVYTTIDSRMQRYAEASVREHLSQLQAVFDKQIKGREPWKKEPAIIENAMRQSWRYISLKKSGASDKDIRKNFSEPIPMTLFSWKGEIDTVMSPLDSLKYYAPFLETGFISLNPTNGHIKAWVGGLNHRYFQYDHVKKGKRQVGSTFKPFVYAAAMDHGFAPCDELLNQPVYFYNADGSLRWAPKNADGKIGGKMTLKKGLANSVNLITAQLIKSIGPETVAEYAYKMGIESYLDPVPSLALGTTDLSVYELVGAYGTIANKGVWNEPVFVTRIEDKNGNIIQEFVGQTREALSEETAYLMVELLKAVANEGTAMRLRFIYNLNNEIGGKTGTTQNHSDGWFVGITPNLVSGAWVGCSDRSVHFSSIAFGQGSRLALPIFGLYMQKVYGDQSIALPKDPFPRPKRLSVELDCRRISRNQEDRGDDPDKPQRAPSWSDLD